MADLGKLQGPLASSLHAGPVPANGRQLVAYVGGRRELTKLLSGMDGPPGRRSNYPSEESYDAARRKWESARENARRYERGQRKPRTTMTEPQRRKARRVADRVKREELAERGARARIKARLRVDTPKPRGRTDARTRVIPPSGPGVFIPASAVRAIQRAVGEDRELAAEDFMDAFWRAYGWDDAEDIAEIEAVYWIKVWPAGEDEPESAR